MDRHGGGDDLDDDFVPDDLVALSDDEDGDSEPGPATPSYAHFKDPLHAMAAGAGAALPGMPKDGAYKKYVLVALGGADS